MRLTYIPFLLLVVPIVEIAVFVIVGQYIGLLPTLALIFVTAIIGSVLLRIQGFGLLAAIRAETDAGRLPGRQLVHGVMILIAGVLLLTPGLVTDTLGFLLFVPAIRESGWRLLRNRLGSLAGSRFSVGSVAGGAFGSVMNNRGGGDRNPGGGPFGKGGNPRPGRSSSIDLGTEDYQEASPSPGDDDKNGPPKTGRRDL